MLLQTFIIIWANKAEQKSLALIPGKIFSEVFHHTLNNQKCWNVNETILHIVKFEVDRTCSLGGEAIEDFGEKKSK